MKEGVKQDKFPFRRQPTAHHMVCSDGKYLYFIFASNAVNEKHTKQKNTQNAM